jgi:hypothetical protein
MVIGRVRELLARGKSGPSPAEGTRAAGASRPGFAPIAPAPAAEQLPPHAPPLPEVAEYFDRLDQAFTNYSANTPAQAAPPSPVPAEMIDWFGSPAPADDAPIDPDAWEIPASSPEGAADEEEEPPEPSSSFWPSPETEPAHVPPAPDLAPRARADGWNVPPLAQAFAALLAAERSAPGPGTAPMWSAPPPDAPPAVIGEEVIEEVTRRVMERLTDRAVRESAAAIATTVAERLIREEIDRIKSALK